VKTAALDPFNRPGQIYGFPLTFYKRERIFLVECLEVFAAA